MADYIPRPNAVFNDWQNNMFGIISEKREQWKIGEAVFARLAGLRSQWNSAYALASNRHNRTEANVTAKNEALAAYKKELRMFVKSHLAFSEYVTDAERDSMGLTLRSPSRTAAQAPTTAPVAEIDFSTRLRHIIHFRDSNATGRAKPGKVHGCEIWSKAGGQQPESEAEMTYLGVDTCTPFTVSYQGGQQGQTAYYMLRWVSTRGQHGPWSAMVSAVIA
ncbi:MAG: hypothetical protein LBV26_04850 [Bacteroidales bacterium]|jgi:hypothetical protein|nr:hypothetical protein [Bacteroidales bacterium]